MSFTYLRARLPHSKVFRRNSPPRMHVVFVFDTLAVAVHTHKGTPAGRLTLGCLSSQNSNFCEIARPPSVPRSCSQPSFASNVLGSKIPQKFFSRINASEPRQPLVKGERLVRFWNERCDTDSLDSKTIYTVPRRLDLRTPLPFVCSSGFSQPSQLSDAFSAYVGSGGQLHWMHMRAEIQKTARWQDMQTWRGDANVRPTSSSGVGLPEFSWDLLLLVGGCVSCWAAGVCLGRAAIQVSLSTDSAVTPLHIRIYPY